MVAEEPTLTVRPLVIIRLYCFTCSIEDLAGVANGYKAVPYLTIEKLLQTKKV